ncbi:MAG: hypothetical protein HZA92_16895 [Verrucomicrobia bacterium]|nr:hypothetical protein [Verrucomicrobiota bacterium]
MPGYLKCTCEHCGGRIEYPAEAVGANAPCPHCQRETPLKLDGGDDSDIVTVGGGKARLVLGTIVACVIAVAVLAAAGIWVKKQRGGKDSPVASASGKTGATPAPANLQAKVELDPPKPVVPFVGKFQNGLTAAQIKSGREIIGGACTDCHRQYDPATYGGEEWNRIVGTMRGKAKLRPRQSDDLDTFVRSVRN